MKRYVLVGLLVVVAVLVTLAPATLLQRPLANLGAVDVQQLRGTLWRGQALVSVAAQPLGTVRWSVLPAKLLTGALTAQYQLDGDHLNLQGQVSRGLNQFTASTQGRIGPALVNQLLAPYELKMSGTLSPQAVAGTVLDNQISALAGQVQWSGGAVSYALQNHRATQVLPAMRAELSLDEESLPLAAVYSDTVNYPLVTLRLMAAGFVKVSLTRRFTQMVDMPWPGSEPDHAVVLEVEQQVF